MRRNIPLGILYFVGIFVTAALVHESAHIVVALFMGIPFNELKIGFSGMNPSVTIPERFTTGNLSILYYSGGLVAAGFLTFIYSYWYKRYQKKPTFTSWFMGLITIAIAGFHLAQGYTEGRFHSAYIYFSRMPLSPLAIIISIFVIVSILW